MRILMFAVNDPAGAGMALCAALSRHTECKARLVTLETRYNHNFARDMHIPDLDAADLDELETLLRTSDVFHFHMTADEDTRFGPFLPKDHLRGKRVVHHHHGHPDFRGDPEKYRRKYRERQRRNLLVSTPDLLRLLPGARWQPNAVPVDEAAYTPLAARPDGPLRIGQSPTNKALKNTEEFVRITDELAATPLLPRNERLLIDNVPHKECLRLKRTADIFFDHMQGYFGMSSLEALSQGVPTVAGLDDWNLEQVEDFAGLPAPWVIARDGDSLKRRLEELLLDADARLHLGRRSRSFMESGWNDAKVARRLAEYYAGLDV
jgi:glycosyltransferase involved in cell wall biosynthesis